MSLIDGALPEDADTLPLEKSIFEDDDSDEDLSNGFIQTELSDDEIPVHENGNVNPRSETARH